MAVKRTYVKRGRPAIVPISPDQAQKRRDDIEAQEEYIESLKTGKTMSGGGSAMKVENIDIGALEKQLDRDKRALAHFSAKEGTPSEKRNAQKDYNEAKAYITKNALSWADIGKYPKPNDPEKDADYGKAVEKAISQEVGNPMFQRMCEQFKRAAAILDPNDPELRNVNRCRQ